MNKELRRVVGFLVVIATIGGFAFFIMRITGGASDRGVNNSNDLLQPAPKPRAEVIPEKIADVRITGVEIVNTVVCKDADVQFRVSVENVGQVDAKQIQLVLFEEGVDDVPDAIVRNHSLLSGSGDIIPINFTYKGTGPEYISNMKIWWPLDGNPTDNLFSVPVKYSSTCTRAGIVQLFNPGKIGKQMAISVKAPNGGVEEQLYWVAPESKLAIPVLDDNITLSQNKALLNSNLDQFRRLDNMPGNITRPNIIDRLEQRK